jgi:hypothetical protein
MDDFFTPKEVLAKLEAPVKAPRTLNNDQPVKEWELNHPLLYLHVQMNPKMCQEWINVYSSDAILLCCWRDPDLDAEIYCPGLRYVKDKEGLLFFYNANLVPKLCVPQALVPTMLREAHKLPFKSAHPGFECLWLRVSKLYFWPSMKKDITTYCVSCDICQKVKYHNITKYRYLRPQDVPSCPYKSILLDLIGLLPESQDRFMAILVIVDCLSKNVQFIPVDFDTKSKGFGYLFVKHAACCFDLLNTVYTNWDGCWFSIFWSVVAQYLKTNMVLLLARYPQHDSQTEIVNWQLEVML